MHRNTLKAMMILAGFATSAGCDWPAPNILPGPGGGRLPPEHRQPDLRNQLLAKLQGQTDEQKLQTLLDVVTNDNSELVRRDALDYLCGLGKDASPIAQPLADRLIIESDQRMVPYLKETLVQIQVDVEPYLVSSATSASEVSRRRIIEVLGDLPASKPASIDFLRQQLSAKEHANVIAACESLRQIGPAGKQTLPTLVEIAASSRVPLAGSNDRGAAFRKSRDLQGAAVRAIAAVGADATAIDVLIAALGQEPQIAEHAAKALGDLGPAADAALPELENLYARDDHGGKDIKTRLAREAAANAIASIKRKGN